MRRIIRSRPSPALVISMLALIVALSGTATALSGKNKIDHNDLQQHVVHAGKIHNQAVKTSKIADDAVNSAKVADQSLTGLDIANGTIGVSDLGNNSVDSSEIIAGAVTAPKLADSAFLSSDIARNTPGGPFGIPSDAIDATEISSSAVTSSKIANSAVGSSKISNGAVTVPKLNAESGVVIVDFGAIPGGQCSESTVSAPGVTTTDNLILTLDHTVPTTNDVPTGTPTGVVWFAKQSNEPGFFRVVACSVESDVGQNPPPATLRYLAIHP